VSLSNHLQWNIINGYSLYIIIWCVWLFFFCFSFFYNQHYIFIFIVLLLLLITRYQLYKDGSVPSVWCWVVNGFAVYFAAYLLFYLPFMEKR